MTKYIEAFIFFAFFCAITVIAQDKTVVFTRDIVHGSNQKFNSGTAKPDTIMYGGIEISSKNAAFAIKNISSFNFYGGKHQFLALAGTITKVEFTFDSNNNNSFKGDGYSKGVWKGNAQSFTLTTDHVVKVSKIIVTYRPFDIPLVGDGSRANPFTVSDALSLSRYYVSKNSDILSNSCINIKGIVGSVNSVPDEISKLNTCCYSIVDSIDGVNYLNIKAGRYLSNADFISAEQIQKGDQVVAFGKLLSSQDPATGRKTTELASGNYISVFWGNDVVIDETANNEITNDLRHATIRMTRSFAKKAWNSLVLPFDMSAQQVKKVFKENIQIADYVGTTLNADETYTLNLESCMTITANHPVFVYGAANVENVVIEDVNIVKGTSVNMPSDAAFAFVGSYGEMALQENDWFISSDNNFYRAKGNEKMKATRAVFRPVSSITSTKSLKTNLVDRPTGVSVIANDDNRPISNIPIYNLAGQRVTKSYRGVVVSGGKKYLNL